MHINRAIKRIFQGLGVIVLVIVLLLGLFIACAAIFNFIASDKAENFCNSTVIGEPVSSVTARAEAQKATIVMSTTGSDVSLIFHGFVFARASCHLSIENGHVKSKSFEYAHD